MAKLYTNIKKKKESAHGNRFYTSRDMAIAKHDEAVKNAQIKRGERADKGNNYVSLCGCGAEGCFIHGEFETINQDDYNKFLSNKRKHHGAPKYGKAKKPRKLSLQTILKKLK